MKRFDAVLQTARRIRTAGAWTISGGIALAAGAALAQTAPAPAAEKQPAPAAPAPPKSAAPAPGQPSTANPQSPIASPNSPDAQAGPGAMKARVRQRVEERAQAAKGEKFKEADTDGDGAVSKAEYAAYLDKRFAALDPDGDGKLAEPDFAKAFSINVQSSAADRAAVPVQSPEIAQIIMRRLDANGDGKIEKSEAPPALMEDFDKMDENHDGALGPDDTGLVERTRERMVRQSQAKRPQGFLERYDANKDGKLQKEEAPDAIKRSWDKLDLNKDGVITTDETRLGREAAIEEAKKKAAEAPAPGAVPQPAPAKPGAPQPPPAAK